MFSPPIRSLLAPDRPFFYCIVDGVYLVPLFLHAPARRVFSRRGLAGSDFLSRFFAPGIGIDEDPVTGSAHCCLAPYWASKLGRQEARTNAFFVALFFCFLATLSYHARVKLAVCSFLCFFFLTLRARVCVAEDFVSP